VAAAEAAEGGGARARIEPGVREDQPGMLSLLKENVLPEDGLDALVIGAGQAGLAAGYHLRRAGLSFAILAPTTRLAPRWQKGCSALSPATASRR
jgi:shikimate 5-dehydrogenase